MTEPTLPPLPPEREMGRNRNDDATVLGYTADQLRAAQLAAIEPYRRDAERLRAAASLVLAWFEAENDHAKQPDFYMRIAMCRDAEEALRAAMRQEGDSNA